MRLADGRPHTGQILLCCCDVLRHCSAIDHERVTTHIYVPLNRRIELWHEDNVGIGVDEVFRIARRVQPVEDIFEERQFLLPTKRQYIENGPAEIRRLGEVFRYDSPVLGILRRVQRNVHAVLRYKFCCPHRFSRKSLRKVQFR